MANCSDCLDEPCEHLDVCDCCSKCIVCGAPSAPPTLPLNQGDVHWPYRSRNVPAPMWTPEYYERYEMTYTSQSQHMVH